LPSTQRDLFSPVIPADKLNPLFRYAAQDPGHAGARAMANAVFANLRDVDGTFLREFQAAGFSARVFELALFAYLEEQDLELDRTHPAPDFVVRGDLPVAIEVTTTNPAQDTPLDPGPPYTLVPDDLEAADAEFVFQLGKALRRKLLHRDAQDRAYWEKPHVAGLPFVIAVGAFHGPHAQIHPDGLLASYLYGVRGIAHHDETGKLTITPENVTEHHSVSKTIPSGLFRHPEAANLAGVLFSNAHTIAKFNRIGIEQGFGTPDTALMRFGTCYDYDPDASKPLPFAYIVGDRPNDEQENFEEGLHLFINPWATVPLPAETLPGVVTYQLRDDGILETAFPIAFRPFVSKTMVFHQQHAPIFARYAQLLVLGQLPPDAPKIFGTAASPDGSPDIDSNP
jgi:hypothetical protein